MLLISWPFFSLNSILMLSSFVIDCKKYSHFNYENIRNFESSEEEDVREDVSSAGLCRKILPGYSCSKPCCEHF